MGAGATTLAETPKPDLELSQSDSLSTFDSLAQSSTLGQSMSMKQSWHASYMQRSRSAKIREDDVPHKLAISFGGSGRSVASLPARIDKVLDVTIQREVERLESRLIFLASVGSAGPYLGLFGTVWGVMTSFVAIAASQNTSLAVVAPGIAEALFATAIGLVAAIPAVIAYNKFQAEVAKAQIRLEGFADEFSAILARQVDERLATAA